MLQERTGGFTEFVPLCFIPFRTMLGRTDGIEEISAEESLQHTAVFGIPRSSVSHRERWELLAVDAPSVPFEFAGGV